MKNPIEILRTLTGVGCLAAAGLLLVAGCTPDQAAETKPVVNEAAGGDDHHDHVHGPKGGEMFEFAEAGLKGEWVARYGDNLVTVYIYGDDGKTANPIKADRLVASRKVKDVETWDLEAVNAADGMASKFEVVDEKFAIAMKTTGAGLEVEIDGVRHSTQLPKDPHAH